MVEYDRGDGGKFAIKGATTRVFRGIRLTDATWEVLGSKADELDISRADYLEGLFLGEIDWESEDSDSDENELDYDKDELIEDIKECLSYSGKTVSRMMKAKLKEILEKLGEDPEDE